MTVSDFVGFDLQHNLPDQQNKLLLPEKNARQSVVLIDCSPVFMVLLRPVQ